MQRSPVLYPCRKMHKSEGCILDSNTSSEYLKQKDTNIPVFLSMFFSGPWLHPQLEGCPVPHPAGADQGDLPRQAVQQCQCQEEEEVQEHVQVRRRRGCRGGGTRWEDQGELHWVNIYLFAVQMTLKKPCFAPTVTLWEGGTRSGASWRTSAIPPTQSLDAIQTPHGLTGTGGSGLPMPATAYRLWRRRNLLT